MRQVTLNLITVEEASKKERMVGEVEFHSMDGSYEAKLSDIKSINFALKKVKDQVKCSIQRLEGETIWR